MEWRLDDDDAHESLMIEVEMLTSSYTEDELQWRPAEKSDTNPTLWLSARPKTAADTRLQFVKADLCFTVSKDYPGVAPEVEVLVTRGLGDAQVSELKTEPATLTTEMLGGPMLLSLVEACEDVLTKYNLAGECSICLEAFEGGEKSATTAVVKTEPCFHRFHAACLANAWRIAVNEAEEQRVQRARAALHTDGGGRGGGGGVKSASSSSAASSKDKLGHRGEGAAAAASSSEKFDLEIERRNRAMAALMVATRSSGGGGGVSTTTRPHLDWRAVRLSCPECRSMLGAADHPFLAALLDHEDGGEGGTKAQKKPSADAAGGGRACLLSGKENRAFEGGAAKTKTTKKEEEEEEEEGENEGHGRSA